MISNFQKSYNIPFRGNRNYNWGADITKKILDDQCLFNHGKLTNLYIKINNYSQNDIKASSKKIDKLNDSLLGTIQYEFNGKLHLLYLYEDQNQ